MNAVKISGLLKSLSNGGDIMLDSSPFTIGRCRTARLIIPSVNISRNHCQLKLSEIGTWIVEDLSSSGTFLNDELVGKDNSSELKNNDIIRLGPKECNFVWQFKKENEMNLFFENSSDNMHCQSQAIVEICNKKNCLQRKIINNRECCLQMKIEKENLHAEYLSQMKSLEKRWSTDEMGVGNVSDGCKNYIEKVIEQEKIKFQTEMEKRLLKLEDEINENNKFEEKLKLEIQMLQEKLAVEQLQWEKKFIKEKKILEEKIKEQNEVLAYEKLKVEAISLGQDQGLKDKLKKEEEEKSLLLEKIKEMELTKEVLSKKFKELDEFHIMEKARLETEMKHSLMEKEENIQAIFQERIEFLQKFQDESYNNIKAEMELENNEHHKNLLVELDKIKNTLSKTESRQNALEKELEQAVSLHNEASKVKSTVLENIADLMETELQCSICSELFVTAITLNCTHTFCKYCLDMWKKRKKNCPICRKKIINENRSIVVDNYIDKMVENLSEDFKSRRLAVIADRINGKHGRKN